MASVSELQAELDKLNEVVDGLNDEFTEYLNEKCDRAALNWLRFRGIPKTPAEVYDIFHVLYQGLPAALILDGKLEPVEGVVASDEVKAARRAKRDKNQLSFADLTAKDEDGSSFGQYL